MCTIFSFFVVLVVYLVAGILFMKYRRGATGKEVIPNVEFWSSLPGLIKVSDAIKTSKFSNNTFKI